MPECAKPHSVPSLVQNVLRSFADGDETAALTRKDFTDQKNNRPADVRFTPKADMLAPRQRVSSANCLLISTCSGVWPQPPPDYKVRLL
jgi:hypothetical protein